MPSGVVSARTPLVACLLLSLWGGNPCFGATATFDDPFSMLQEQRTVTGANRRPQPISETPSSVSILTAAEIRTRGYQTLGEALQWVRGIYTRYDRNYTFLGVRGLQRPGDYNNKVLLTIDGHTVNSPIYGDAAFGGELGLDLERVERIEVVRGPGSTVYGSNAVLAVVNVVTRDPRATPGIEVSARAGEQGDRRGYFAMASARGDRPQIAISGSWSDTPGGAISAPGFAPLGSTASAAGADGERAAGVLGVLEWRDLRFTAKFNERLKHVPTGSFGTVFGDPRTLTHDGHDFVELSDVVRPGRSLELTTRAYWDASRYRGEYLYASTPTDYLEQDLGYSDVIGAESRAHWRPGDSQVVTAGAEGRWVLRALQYTYDVDPYLLHSRSDSRESQASAYAQDELTLARGARLTAGLRIDSYSMYGNVASPRLDLVIPAGAGTTWKLMAGSAYRAPTPYETRYRADDQIPNTDLLPERLSTLEGCVEQRLGRANLTLSLYRNWIRDLVDPAFLDTLGTFTFSNVERVRSFGAETEIEVQSAGGTRARADLAWQRSDELATGQELTNSPRWNGHLVLTHPRIAGPLFGGLGIRWLSSRTTMQGTRLPSFSILDARVGVEHRDVTFAIQARNLLDIRYSDPAASEHFQDALVQDGRALFFTVGYRRVAD